MAVSTNFTINGDINPLSSTSSSDDGLKGETLNIRVEGCPIKSEPEYYLESEEDINSQVGVLKFETDISTQINPVKRSEKHFQ